MNALASRPKPPAKILCAVCEKYAYRKGSIKKLVYGVYVMVGECCSVKPFGRK